MLKFVSFFFILIILFSCSSPNIEFEEKNGFEMVSSGDHKLATKTIGSGHFTILFEAGIGGNNNDWIKFGIVKNLENKAKIILYNRAGYEPSDKTDSPATIENMIKDLDSVITHLADGDKLILVGHSLGGAIIRAYSVKYPEKVSGLVFIETSHEILLQYNSEEDKEKMLKSMREGGRDASPAYKEYKYVLNTLKYLEALDNIPDIPVIALSGSDYSYDVLFGEGFRKSLTNAHKSMGIGLSDFTHIKVLNSGHYTQIDQPEIVTSAILEVLNKVKKEEGVLGWLYDIQSKWR